MTEGVGNSDLTVRREGNGDNEGEDEKEGWC